MNNHPKQEEEDQQQDHLHYLNLYRALRAIGVGSPQIPTPLLNFTPTITTSPAQFDFTVTTNRQQQQMRDPPTQSPITTVTQRAQTNYFL